MSMYHRALRAAYNRALKWEWIEKNPFLKVEVAKTTAGSTTRNMSFGEVQKLLNAIDEDGDAEFGNLIRFLLYTGCRRNEIRCLRFEDVDRENWTLKIYAQKTGKDMVLPINKALKRVIEGMDWGEGYIFKSRSGGHRAKFKEQPWSESWVTHRFKSYIRECGLAEEYRLHSLRHTYSSFLIEQGIPIDIVSKLLGHSSVRVTADNYDHSLALHFRSQADLVDFENNS